MAELYNHEVTNLYDAMEQSIRRIGIIQTNLENVNTVSFKTIHPESVMFSDVMGDVFRDESQGVLAKTNQKLDLALTRAEAFFLVDGEDGQPVRTRDGQFNFDKKGNIVDSQGRELVILDKQIDSPGWKALPEGGNLAIDQNGAMRVNGDYIGRIAVDYQSKMPGDRVFVLQGKLETSNVDLQANITKIMQIKRHIDTVQSMLSMELGVDKALIETYGRNI